MKKFAWEDFIKKIGGKKEFVKFLIITILTIASMIWVFLDIGLSIVIESIMLSILFDYAKEYIKVLKEVDEKFTIEIKKK